MKKEKNEGVSTKGELLQDKKIAEIIWQHYEANIKQGEYFDAHAITEIIMRPIKDERQKLLDSNRELKNCNVEIRVALDSFMQFFENGDANTVIQRHKLELIEDCPEINAYMTAGFNALKKAFELSK